MPTATVPVNAIATGPGFLYYANLASALPANTVVGSVFTDAWPGAWSLLGATDDGSEFSYSVKTDDVEVAEYLDPIQVVPTGRTISMKFSLVNVSAANFKKLTNGGTITTSGSGTTLLSEFVAPALGSEVRCMIGWESQDCTERIVGYQCLQTGEISPARKKGSDKAMLAAEFRFEKPASGEPFKYWTAGTARG